MCKDGNYFWDRNNQCLVKSNHGKPEIVKGEIASGYPIDWKHCCSPISISDDLLIKVLGFSSDKACGYTLGKIHIVFNGKATYGGPYSLLNQPVHFLNDIQDICGQNSIQLNIDENLLYNYLLGIV